MANLFIPTVSWSPSSTVAHANAALIDTLSNLASPITKYGNDLINNAQTTHTLQNELLKEQSALNAAIWQNDIKNRTFLEEQRKLASTGLEGLNQAYANLSNYEGMTPELLSELSPFLKPTYELGKGDRESISKINEQDANARHNNALASEKEMLIKAGIPLEEARERIATSKTTRTKTEQEIEAGKILLDEEKKLRNLDIAIGSLSPEQKSIIYGQSGGQQIATLKSWLPDATKDLRDKQISDRLSAFSAPSGDWDAAHKAALAQLAKSEESMNLALKKMIPGGKSSLPIYLFDESSTMLTPLQKQLSGISDAEQKEKVTSGMTKYLSAQIAELRKLKPEYRDLPDAVAAQILMEGRRNTSPDWVTDKIKFWNRDEVIGKDESLQWGKIEELADAAIVDSEKAKRYLDYFGTQGHFRRGIAQAQAGILASQARPNPYAQDDSGTIVSPTASGLISKNLRLSLPNEPRSKEETDYISNQLMNIVNGTPISLLSPPTIPSTGTEKTENGTNSSSQKQTTSPQMQALVDASNTQPEYFSKKDFEQYSVDELTQLVNNPNTNSEVKQLAQEVLTNKIAKNTKEYIEQTIQKIDTTSGVDPSVILQNIVQVGGAYKSTLLKSLYNKVQNMRNNKKTDVPTRIKLDGLLANIFAEMNK